MNAKEYLEQIRELEHKIYCMKLRSEYYDKMSLSIPGPTYGEKIGFNPNRNTEAPFMKWLIKKDEIDREIIKLVGKLNLLKAEALVKIEELTTSLNSKEEEIKNLKADALLKIEALDNEDYKVILIERYFNHKTWNEIALKIYASEKTVRRWHENALVLLKIGENVV